MTAKIIQAVRQAGYLLPLLLLTILVTYLMEPRFLASANVSNVLRIAAFLAIVSCGQMLVIIAGGFDLSVGAVVALSSVVSALVMNQLMEAYPDFPLMIAVAGGAVGLLIGAVVGALNGYMAAYVKASPFMVTLGMLSMVSGAAYFLTAGIPIYGLPDTFTREFGRAISLGIPLPAYIAAVVVLGIWVLQSKTSIGRHWYAIGGNVGAARRSGIPIERNLFLIYTLCGVFAAASGVLLTARIGSGQASLGSDLVLQSIAACMLAGVALSGGVGRVGHVALAALFIATLGNALNLVRIDSKIQTVIIGVIVLAAVAARQLRSSRSQS